MSKRDAQVVVVGNDAWEHPASQAWNRLDGGAVPNKVVVLKDVKKTLLCRLIGVGISGGDVIVKRSPRNTIEVEGEIYKNILPKLPLRSLHFYGMLEDPDNNYCWLFIEDAGDKAYLPSTKEHHAVTGHWLGIMHTSSAHIDESSQLPDRGPQNYLNWLQLARSKIQSNLTNPNLNSDDIDLLMDIIAHCDVLEERWSNIENICHSVPLTLVHGDFKREHILIQTSLAGTEVLTIDWEHSGWGVPAIDLNLRNCVDIFAYWSVVRHHWSNLDVQTLNQLASVGVIFQSIASIYWESFSLEYEWVDQCMRNMQIYKYWLEDFLITDGSMIIKTNLDLNL